MIQIYRMAASARATRTLAASAMLLASMGAGSAFAAAENIVLVHGMNMDGSSWRPVYEILAQQGYTVNIVQQPLTGLEDDLRATRQVLDQLDGPVVLVGHSYGGVVITAAGSDPDVGALVYLAAFQPDSGETIGALHAEHPALMDTSAVAVSEDGFATVAKEGFMTDIAPDLPPAEVDFLFASQTPTTLELMTAETQGPAWRAKPSFAVLASEDRVISPELQRWMYDRSGSDVTEIAAGHMVYMSQPAAVAEVIMKAAQAAE